VEQHITRLYYKMKRLRCITCGCVIQKSGLHDPYQCRECETELRMGRIIDRYSYLDSI